MEWTAKFQLFLFDFDGLLVDTEAVHYQAYQQMSQISNLKFDLDFLNYLIVAHSSAEGLKNYFCQHCPSISDQQWQKLYRLKTELFLQLIKETEVNLMKGAKELITHLNDRHQTTCVVTNSPKPFIDAIVSKHKILQTISHWITKEQYSRPKPSPECYQLALQKLGQNGERAIGFEDSLKGFQALSQCQILPVLICHEEMPFVKNIKLKAGHHFSTLTDIKL